MDFIEDYEEPTWKKVRYIDFLRRLERDRTGQSNPQVHIGLQSELKKRMGEVAAISN